MKNTMNIIKKTMSMAMGVCLCLMAEAATAPKYQFYSTSMHSKAAQQGYTSSRVTQSGSIKYEGTMYDVLRTYEGTMYHVQKGGNARAFSANVFTQPGKVFVVGEMATYYNNTRITYHNNQSSHGIIYGSGSTSLPALNVSRRNAADLAKVAEEASGIRPLREGAANPGTPGSSGNQLPLGNALWPLMLMALAFGGRKLIIEN